MPPLPFPSTDPIGLADWLEVIALLADDRSSSIGDLERALHRSAVLEVSGSREAVDEKCAEVFTELRERTYSAGDSYPFEVEGSVVRLRSRAEDFPAYIFCLCLSSLRTVQAKGEQVFPRRLFEDLACIAVRNYIGGKSVRFASPRVELPHHFGKAVAALCLRIGEGEGYRKQPPPRSQDRTLDVVAWKHFPDALPGKLIVFGQCASGANWRGKVAELQPRVFCDHWMNDPPVSFVLKAFFIPHRIPSNHRKLVSREAGIVFDRCRLAFWVHQDKRGLKNRAELTRWSRKAIAQERVKNKGL
jgi:hypothetical protein